MLKIFIFLLCLLSSLQAKVEAPNYSFSLDTLEAFFPGKKISEIEMKYGKGETMSDGLQKFYVDHLRYKFPVIVQSKDGLVVDFFAKLPSYFLHDVYFQSLVNRLGKQNSYKKVGEEALYEWEKKPLKHVYSAACTITCFPIFYSVSTMESGGKSILDKMKEAAKK
jgi:hypothetical protein